MDGFITESFKESKAFFDWKKITVRKYFNKFFLLLLASASIIFFIYYSCIKDSELKVIILELIFAGALSAVSVKFFRDYMKVKKAKLSEVKKVKIIEKYRHSKYNIVKDKEIKGYFLGVEYNTQKEEAVCYEDVFNKVSEGDYVIAFSVDGFSDIYAVVE